MFTFSLTVLNVYLTIVNNVDYMHVLQTGTEGTCSLQRKLMCNECGLISLFEAAMCLIEEVALVIYTILLKYSTLLDCEIIVCFY